MEPCEHTITQDDICINCGKTVYATEHRPCKDCKHFRPMQYDIPLCRKKMMSVCGDMHVYYLIEDGTCFSPKDDGDK